MSRKKERKKRSYGAKTYIDIYIMGLSLRPNNVQQPDFEIGIAQIMRCISIMVMMISNKIVMMMMIIVMKMMTVMMVKVTA